MLMYCNQNVGQNRSIKTADKYFKNGAKFKYSQTGSNSYNKTNEMH